MEASRSAEETSGIYFIVSHPAGASGNGGGTRKKRVGDGTGWGDPRHGKVRMQTNREADDRAAVLEAIRGRHSLGSEIAPFAFGSVPVFAVGREHVVKLFPSAQRSYFEIEREALVRLDGLLPVATPRAVAAGEQASWCYIVMTRVPGISLAEAWPEIDARGRHRLMRETGTALAALHATPADGFAYPGAEWPRFVEGQRATCPARQLGRGLAAPWVEAVEAFLARWTPRDDGARGFLHTEVMKEHVLVAQRGGEWRVTGLIDFEDAMVGAPEYEWAAAGLFLTAGEPSLLRALLEAYGAAVDDELPLRIMAYALLHKYSDLRRYLERLPVPDGVRDLETLARSWFTPSPPRKADTSRRGA
jgi:hygromycin-B 7''-O-kinase